MEIHETTFSQPPVAGAAPEPEQARSFDPDALTRALRIAGAALVVASASTFMLQHWGGGNDLIRYGMLVGQALLLGAAAYFVGLTLREGRSARTFLALVLATIPVSFAVLGGLVYSQFHVEGVRVLPSYATWVAPSKLSAVLAVVGTLAVFVPLAAVSFVALARKEAKLLTTAFFAANLLVLVPVRQPLIIMALSGVTFLGLLRLDLRRYAGRAQLATLEAKLARVMPFFAPAIMLGRVFHLYHAGAAFLGSLLIMLAAGVWLLVARPELANKRDAGAWASALLSGLGWCLCWPEVLQQLHLGDAESVLVVGLPVALLLALASHRAAQTRSVLLGSATGAALLTSLVACVVQLESIAPVACIVVGVAVAVWGASVRALLRTLSGSVVAVIGLVVQVWLATRADNVLRWASLSVVGVLLIIGSAYVERNRGRIARFWADAAARRLAHENA